MRRKISKTGYAEISRYHVPLIDNIPDYIRKGVLDEQQKSGFLPHVFLMLAYRPAEFRAFMANHDALMDKDGGNCPPPCAG